MRTKNSMKLKALTIFLLSLGALTLFSAEALSSVSKSEVKIKVKSGTGVLLKKKLAKQKLNKKIKKEEIHSSPKVKVEKNEEEHKKIYDSKTKAS